MDQSGRGLALIWRRQIQQLNRVSSEMASAIVDAYPSPQLLVQVCYGCRYAMGDLALQTSRGQECRSAVWTVSLRKARFSCLNLPFLTS